MSRMLLVDTDVVIDFLRGRAEAGAFFREHAADIALSALTVAELHAGVRDGGERRKLDEFISLFPVLPVTREIAAAGGLHKRDYGKSHGVGLADGVLAATAEHHKAALRTLNTRHYPMLKDAAAPYAKL